MKGDFLMQSKMKQAYIGEIQYQTKMLNNLKVWLRNMIMLYFYIINIDFIWKMRCILSYQL